MNEIDWRKGPPPHVGWWNASTARSAQDVWRWWNGKYWSLASVSARHADEAAIKATKKAIFESVEWNDYWPENARVPRVDPRRKS